jgi:hypothetical protein
MTPFRFCCLRSFSLAVLGAVLALAQNTSTPAPNVTDPGPATAGRTTTPKATVPDLSLEEKERFLKVADILDVKPIEEQPNSTFAGGTTHTMKATLSDGRLTHAAHIQQIDIYKPVFRGKDGSIEKNFRDSYKFNIAAYRLAKMISLADMVPPSVEREYQGKPGAFTWWVDDVMMDELTRRDKKIPAPTTQYWIDQLNKVRVFDQLIYNTDRNQGNLLITHSWKLIMIDHTRAFRTAHTLLNPAALGRCDQKLLEGMRRLTLASLNRELGPYLRAEEITALLARRDIIVKYFDSEISKKGVDAVLTGIPRKTPEAVIP